MEKCKNCNGNKHILGMGNMREKCKPCDGKGFIAFKEPSFTPPDKKINKKGSSDE